MIRFGLIGTGPFAAIFVNSARLHPEFELGAVYSRRLETARAFCAPFGSPRLYDDLSAMLADPALDAVFIASPIALHYPQAMAALEAGKHVLCEKTIATNSRELDDMLARADARGLVLMEAMKSTLMPNFQAVEQNIGRVGRIRRMTLVYCQYSSRYQRFLDGERINVFDPAMSGGALMDIGVYCVHPMVRLLGMPQTVAASAIRLHNGADGAGAICATYENGVIAELIYSKITDSHLSSEIQGEDGCLLINSVNIPTAVTWIPRGGGAQDLSVPQLDSGHHMFYELDAFIKTVHGAPHPNRADSIHALRVMDEARKQTGLVFAAD